MSPRFPRRHLLRTSAATLAAAHALLADAVGAQVNPAADVADRVTSLRITGLRARWVNPVLFLRIDTNHGVVGYGDIKGVDPRVAKPLVESLFELLDDENPTRIEHLWQKVYRSHRDMRGGPFMSHTLAGIDQALWDITGKLWGVPVH